MNFFQQQDKARRRTSILIFYYVLAVLFILIAINIAFAVIFKYWAVKSGAGSSAYVQLGGMLVPPIKFFGYVTAGTVLLIAGGSIYKIALLSQGGHVVASLLGGRPVPPNSVDLHERTLQNVVEEMSLASGVPVPGIYILDEEDGINAFAAGYSVKDAVIGVTRGCIRRLNRDELQGVIAHEFSHILNGDMRINIRLMGVLHGILLIALTGYTILRSMGRSRRGYSSSRRKKGDGGLVFMLAIGLALLVIGYIGVFFARLIQAAVSRQREFLADASAVQFTRNPDGIAGALKKIGGFSSGSKVENTQAREASHLFFGEAVSSMFGSLLATHPPLVERIQAIDPGFKGEFTSSTVAHTGEVGASMIMPMAAMAPPVPPLTAPERRKISLKPQKVVEDAGSLSPGHIAFASSFLQAIPAEIKEASHDPSGARALVCCILLEKDARLREIQLGLLEHQLEAPVFSEIHKLKDKVDALDAGARLPLLELCLPALRQLSAGQLEPFFQAAKVIIEADEQISLFEYCLYKILVQHLAVVYSGFQKPVIHYYTLNPILPDAAVLLSVLAFAGAADPVKAATAYQRAFQNLTPVISPPPLQKPGWDLVDQALEKISQCSPAIKQKITGACVACVAADVNVELEEAELFRAIMTVLEVPMPPILESA